MNNQFKKFFILPSLLLANSYLLLGSSDLKTNINIEAYSEKVNLSYSNDMLSEVVSEVNMKQHEEKQINLIDVILLSVLSLCITCILFKKSKPSTKKQQKVSTDSLVSIKIKIQKQIFMFVKTIQKTFHSIYQKIFFLSFFR